jgi:hypothetical protein
MHPHLKEHIEHMDAPHPASAEYDRAEARYGASYKDREWHKDRAWLLTARDCWIENPNYWGPPNPPHPEDVLTDEDWDRWDAFHAAWWKAEYAGRPHPTLDVAAPLDNRDLHPDVFEDDIPF